MDPETDSKRSAIREIRKYPIIWNYATYAPSRCQTEKAWIEIATTLNVPLVKSRREWNALRRHYLKMLMGKTIERDRTFPKWVYFHDMSFLYENVKANIKERLGGISPPLLEACPDQADLENEPCPCCVPSTTNHEIPSRKPTSTLTFQNCYEEALRQASDLDSRQGTSDWPESNEPIIIPSRQNDNQIQNVVHRALKRPIEQQNARNQPRAKPKVQISDLSKKQWAIQRPIIIERIKANPLLYDKSSKVPKIGLSWVWKRVAEGLGLQVHLIQSRWRIWKQRYAEELSKKMHSGGKYQPTWPLFEQMSFIAPHLKSNEGNIFQMREEIHKIVQECTKSRTIDLCENNEQVPDQYGQVNRQTPPINSQDFHIFEMPNTSDTYNHADAVEPIDLFEIESQEEKGIACFNDDAPIHSDQDNFAITSTSDQTDVNSEKTECKVNLQSIVTSENFHHRDDDEDSLYGIEVFNKDPE